MRHFGRPEDDIVHFWCPTLYAEDFDATLSSIIVNACASAEVSRNDNTDVPLLHWRLNAIIPRRTEAVTSTATDRSVIFEVTKDAVGRAAYVTYVFIFDNIRFDINTIFLSVNKSTQLTSAHSIAEYETVMSFRPGMEMTVATLIGFIIKQNFHRYRLNTDRSGCLFWTRALVEALEREGFLVAGAAQTVAVSVAKAQRNPNHWCPVDNGEFF